MLCILLLIGLAFFVLKRDERGNSPLDNWRSKQHHYETEAAPSPSEDDALKTARIRLANGELSPKEFEAIKTALLA